MSGINALGPRYCRKCGVKVGEMVGDDTYRNLVLDRKVCAKIDAPRSERGYWCDKCAGRAPA